MPTKYQIVAAVLGSAITYRLVTQPLRRKYVEIARIAIDLGKENETMQKQMEYLVNLINENEIELDEFDWIVLTNVMEQDES